MPGLFEQFPHTNLHELNLDWIIDLINQFKEELEDSAVLSVNGQTGHVTLYESENVILPPLPSGVDQWRLVRLVNGQYVGILFYNGNAYLQRGNETMRLLTNEDIPTSAGVVSWNGRTGIVNVTGMDIPVDDTADADSIYQAITNEHTERVNTDNTLQNNLNEVQQDLSNYIYNGVSKILDGIDVRTINEPGRYYCLGCTNLPDNTGYGYLDVYIYNNNYHKLLFHSANTDSIYTTRLQNGAWQNWKEFALKINTSNFIHELQPNEPRTFHLDNGSRTRIDVIGSNNNNTNSYLVCTTNAGAVTPTPLGTASDLTVTTNTNTITITSTRYTEVFAQSIVGQLPYDIT